MSQPDFSIELSYTLEAAYREAEKRNHEFFTVEHLLFALSYDSVVSDILKGCGADLVRLRKRIEEYFSVHAGLREGKDIIRTVAIDRVLKRAFLQVASSGQNSVGSKDVLVAIFGEEDSYAVQFLSDEGISKLTITEFISHGVSSISFEEELNRVNEEEDDEDSDNEIQVIPTTQKGSVLGRLAENLSEQAALGKLDPIIGREKELERTLQILARRQKNNPLFLGEAGVGKTAMASALAQRIESGDVPAPLKGAIVFSLSIGALIAGTKFRGEFEERIRKLLVELQGIPNSILFIDEIHTIMGAGATGSGSLDVANLLKPALASGKLRIIGSTTYEEFKKTIEKDRALARRFSVIQLDEPSIEETVKILEGLKPKFEEHHHVTFSKSALKSAAELSAKHITGKMLPDKAIDVLDEAGAANSLLIPSKRKSKISDKEIEAAIAAIARVPIVSVSQSDKEVLKNLDSMLRARVFGQDHAIESISRAIKRRRANLSGDRKPVGSFLFAGPTGVGKTELARALADSLGVHFHRFDMSEYMEKHAVSRLVGAPPGYVGYEEGGQLTDLVRQHPYAVILFDEIEKAHEDIFPILLQVMDDANLTDSQGRKTDFKNALIIMTTNAGSEKAASIGFGTSEVSSSRDAAIKKLFKPEFRNRLDEIVHFHPLPKLIIENIVEKFLKEVSDQVKARNVNITYGKELVSFLAEKGFDTVLGARPLQRLIQKEVKDILADEVLFGRLEKGGTVAFSVKDEKISFTIS